MTEAVTEAGQRADDATMPRLLVEHARVRGRRASIREKDLGIWQTWTWLDVLSEVEALAAGLSLLGLGRGDHLAIVGDNRPRLYWSMTAAQALGAVPVPLYQDAITSEMQFVLEDAEVRVAFAEDQEQVDKLLEMLPRLPHLTTILYDDPRGLRHYDAPQLKSYDDVQRDGRALLARDPSFFARHVAEGRSDDVAVMLYTSGTTSKPKGVCQTHRAFIDVARGAVAFDGFDQTRRGAELPADGVGRRSPVLVRRSAGRRLLRQLSRVRRHRDDGSPRDRADLLFRAAARVREPVHAGHNPHG